MVASTQDVNMDGSLAGCAPFGSSTTTLSVHNEEETAITVAVGGNEPSGRYILVAGRAEEKDGVRKPIPAGVLKPAITFSVVRTNREDLAFLNFGLPSYIIFLLWTLKGSLFVFD
ncbi:uncharacterized protein [Triticum aestivum]|uniref:uncharacterized protein n=1 Tax=Triticum aestivum TaxID=4565 RepID=UPI001D021264|nr:uncharacterized protein LOC123172539 [Triticum aestivum]